jgi:CRP-like cAMP-binding protein
LRIWIFQRGSPRYSIRARPARIFAMTLKSVSSDCWITPAIRSSGSSRRVAAGESLFNRNDPCCGVYEVVRGKLRLSVTAQNGHEIVLQTARAGETLAESAIFTPTYQCDATAVTDADVIMYARSAILAEFERNPRAAMPFMAMLASKIAKLRTSIERHNLRSACDRLRHYLVSNRRDEGDSIAIDGSLKDLALELGLTHEALYRALAELEEAGEIKRSKKEIRWIQRSV